MNYYRGKDSDVMIDLVGLLILHHISLSIFVIQYVSCLINQLLSSHDMHMKPYLMVYGWTFNNTRTMQLLYIQKKEKGLTKKGSCTSQSSSEHYNVF